MKHIKPMEHILRERDKLDPNTVSVYEVGSVQFLASLARLPHWEEAGVPVSGDKTLTATWREA
jgi:hypothetical protein